MTVPNATERSSASVVLTREQRHYVREQMQCFVYVRDTMGLDELQTLRPTLMMFFKVLDQIGWAHEDHDGPDELTITVVPQAWLDWLDVVRDEETTYLEHEQKRLDALKATYVIAGEHRDDAIRAGEEDLASAVRDVELVDSVIEASEIAR